MSRLRAYWSIFSIRYQMLLQYRAAALAGFATQLAWGLMLVMIYEAFYRSTNHAQPMHYQEVVTYIWLGQAFLVMLPWNADAEVAGMIRSGNVVYELLRPLDLYSLWYCRSIAQRTAPAFLRAVPMFVIAILCFHMQLPASPAAAGAWLIAMGGALLLGCAITTLTTITLMWTITGEGFAQLLWIGVMFFSGMIIPLPLFPDWAQTILRIMPFSGLVDTPFRLYMGHMAPAEIGWVLLHQLAWTVVFILLGRLLLARGVYRLVVQGG